jgi:hypothetical protein
VSYSTEGAHNGGYRLEQIARILETKPSGKKRIGGSIYAYRSNDGLRNGFESDCPDVDGM